MILSLNRSMTHKIMNFLVLLLSLLIFPLTGRAVEIPFEKCHWTNESYTHRIVRENGAFILLYSNEEEPADNKPDESGPTEGQTAKKPNGKTDSAASATPISNRIGWIIYSGFLDGPFLRRESELSRAGIPVECFFAGAVRGANMYDPGSNFYYCKENSNRPGNMSVEDESNRQRIISPRRACLNRDYMELTARAFNETADCFGFSRTEKESIFRLINHESSFLHNVTSPTGAKCYGQLTTNTIKEINKHIYFRDTKDPHPYSYIFDEVMEKCPGLELAVLNKEITESIETAGKKSMKKFETIVSRTPTSCKTTQNIYSCLFYAFYNIRKNTMEIESHFNRPSSYSEKTDIPPEFKARFSLPMKLNEMLVVKQSDGKLMVFWDDSELWPALKNRPPSMLEEIRKVPLFANEEEVKELFSHWTYNGGISITLKYMKVFIRRLKQSVAVACRSDSEEQRCLYRSEIQEGRGIQTEDIKRDFRIYIRHHYETGDLNKDDATADRAFRQKVRRKEEVANFPDNVTDSLHYLYDENSAFGTHLKKLIPTLEDSQTDAFQNHLKTVCPDF